MFSFIKAQKFYINNVVAKICFAMFVLVFACISVGYCGEGLFFGGEEFQINTDNVGDQFSVNVGILNNGNFIVIWLSRLQDSDNYDVRGQIFDSVGFKIGNEIHISDNNSVGGDGAVRVPGVALLSNGNFIVTSGSWGPDGSRWGVFGQIFDSSGEKVGNRFQINSFTYEDQDHTSISVLNNDNFVVTWMSKTQDGSSWGIYFQIFDVSGNKVGNEIRVNTYTQDVQIHPCSAVVSNGNLVIVWESRPWQVAGQDGSAAGVYGQMFSEEGVKIGGEFRVNTYTNDDQFYSSVAALNDANFVVTWESRGQDGSGKGVYAQIFDENTDKVGDEFRANTYTTNDQRAAKVAKIDENNFVVAWISSDQDEGSSGVYVQVFDLSGTKIGDELQVNTHATAGFPSISVINDGFIVVWSGQNDGESDEIFGRMFFSTLCATNIDQTVNYIEDIPKQLDPIRVFSPINSVNATMEFSDVGAGTLNEVSIDNAVSTYNDILGRWHAWGTLGDMNLILGNLTFTPSLHYSSDFEIDVSITNGNETITDTIYAFGTSGHPEIMGNTISMNYNCGDGCKVIDDSIVITDPNNNFLQNAVVTLVNSVDLQSDSLGFVDQNGIVGSYNDTLGELFLAGNASIENYQDALRSVTYEHTDLSLPIDPITISFAVHDGLYSSNSISRDLTFDSSLAFSAPNSYEYIEDIAIDFPYAEISSNRCTVNVTMTLSDDGAGSLNQETTDGATSIYNPANEWEAWGTVDGVNTLLANLVFTPSLHYSDDFTIGVLVEDETFVNVTDTIYAWGTPNNFVVTTSSSSLNYDCDQGAHIVDNEISITGSNSDYFQRATVSITGEVDSDFHQLSFGGQNCVSADYSSDGLILTGDGCTAADYEAALRSVSYEYSGDGLPEEQIRIFFEVNDGVSTINAACEIEFADSCASPSPSTAKFPSWGWGVIGGTGATVAIFAVAAIGVIWFVKKNSLSKVKNIDHEIEMNDSTP